MNERETDVLIVGQGIAGTVLAHTLLKHGKSIHIIDQPELSASSRISAGLFNPVVFKRLTKSWMVDELIEALVPFYKEVQQQAGEQLLFEKEIVRIFSEEQERVLWKNKRNEEVGTYLSPILEEGLHYGEDVPWGIGAVKKAGNLNVQKFLSLSETLFRKNEMISIEKFDHSKVRFSADEVFYNSISSKKIIFCEGYKGSENPFFNWIPFKHAKGELLTVRIKKYPLQAIINKGVFILPLGNDLFRVGSTFTWDKINDEKTESAKEELITKLKKLINKKFEIIDHQAGVRPSISDRRPVLGMHPRHSQLCIFNGMGSKGVMLSPYFAEHLFQNLFEGKELNREVDIKRFK